MTEDALGVWSIKRQAGEELGRHAASLAGVEGATGRTRPRTLRLPQRGEERGLAPHAGETTAIADVASQEVLVDDERAGVDIADRIDQADHSPGATQVQAVERIAEGREVEERIAGEHRGAIEQPRVELALLGVGQVELVPGVSTPSRWPKAGEPELSAVASGDGFELIELAHVVAGHDHRDLELAEPGLCQVVHRRGRRCEAARTPERVIGGLIGTVDRDLDIDVVAAGQAPSSLRCQAGPVGRELDSHAARGGVLDELEEVAADHRLAPTDVHVEDLEGCHLVDEAGGLFGRELRRVSSAGARQAMGARQVAGIGQLPGEADRRSQPELEAVLERWSLSRHR